MLPLTKRPSYRERDPIRNHPKDGTAPVVEPTTRTPARTREPRELRGRRTNRRGHNGRVKPCLRTTIDSRAHPVPSDAQEQKGDAPGQLRAKNRDCADRPRSSGAPDEAVEAAVDVSQEDIALDGRCAGLDCKKPSARGESAGILGSNLAQIGAQLAAQAIAHHRSSDRAGHCERDARRLVAGLWRWSQHGHRHGATSDPTAAAPQFLERAAITNSPDQADRRRRPLSRRDRRTLRPARVDMRERKPCFFARRRTLGWNVRFTRGLRDLLNPEGVHRSLLHRQRLWCGNGPGLTRAQGARHLFG